MKKWMVGLAAFLAISFFDLWPFPQQDAGELYIVETLCIQQEAGRVILTAGELTAEGENVAEAVNVMTENAPGQLFLRQTKRIIFCGDGETWDPMELPQQLPMGAAVYMWKGTTQMLNLEQVSKVLEARERRNTKTPTLAQLKNSAIAGKPLVYENLE